MVQFELSEEEADTILNLIRRYHNEALKCQEAKAFLAGCVMEGAALEASLLIFANCYPDEALESPAAPRKKDGTVKPLAEWTLANLLAVAKERGWLPTALPLPNGDRKGSKAHIGDYAEVLREMRNLVHPIRYATDMPRKRITERYLDAAFEILDVVVEYLLKKLLSSIQESLNEEEEPA